MATPSNHHATNSGGGGSSIVGGHYRVGKKIGEGSFGVVFEGQSHLKLPLTLAALDGLHTAHVLGIVNIRFSCLCTVVSLLSVTSPSVLHESYAPLGCLPSPAFSTFGTREALREHTAVYLISLTSRHLSVGVPTAAIC